MPPFQECVQQYEHARTVTEEVEVIAKIPRNVLMKEEAHSLPFLISCQRHCLPRPAAATPGTASVSHKVVQRNILKFQEEI